MTPKEKIQFIKRLSFLVKANIPIETSLITLSEQINNKSGKKIIRTILERVKEGESLFRALTSVNKSFNGAVWSIIRVGEESGTLSESLTQLAIILERGLAARSKIIQALFYPLVIAFGTLVLTSFLILYIFPKITPIFASLKVPLPLATKILINVSVFFRSNFLWVLICSTVSVLSLFLLIKFSERARFECSKLLMKIPLFGTLIQTYMLARISTLLGTLLSSQMKVDEAIKLISESVRYPVYRKFLAGAVVEVSHGVSLSQLCSKNHSLFPKLFTNMVAIGEISGSFSDVLKDLALIYESELENSAKILTQMIEPILMIFMSLIVGFVAISIIAPLYNISSNLQH